MTVDGERRVAVRTHHDHDKRHTEPRSTSHTRPNRRLNRSEAVRAPVAAIPRGALRRSVLRPRSSNQRHIDGRCIRPTRCDIFLNKGTTPMRKCRGSRSVTGRRA
jgi:hypothetical protein